MKRRTLTILLGSAVIVAGVMTAFALGQQPRDDAPRWQYATLAMEEGTNYYYSPDGDLPFVITSSLISGLTDLYGVPRENTEGSIAYVLNLIGNGGWELATAARNVYTFKRPY